MQEVRVRFEECRSSACTSTHVQFESAEQARMVAECRARAERERVESAARREQFRATGVWR
jgi:hypothetical protein